MVRELTFSTLPEMVEVLRQRNIDVENFDFLGNKTLAQLFDECEQREVVLMHDELSGRVIRVAFTAAVLIRVVDSISKRPLERVVKEKLVEVERIYPERRLANGTVVPERRVANEKPWSISETRRKNFEFSDRAKKIFAKRGAVDMLQFAERTGNVEAIAETAIRGLFEELGLYVYQEQLEYSFPETQGHEFREYLSSTYYQIWSSTHVQRFTVDYTARPWPLIRGGARVRDNGTEIISRWKQVQQEP